MSAPRRLLDDPASSDALRDDLRAAAQAEPDYDAERGLVALQAAVAGLGTGALGTGASQTTPPPPTAAAHGAATTSGAATGALGSGAAKLAIAAVVTAIGLGAIGSELWLERAPAPPAPPAPAQIAPVAAPAAAPDVQPPSPASEPAVEPLPAALPTAEPARPAPHLGHPRPPHAAAAPVDPDRALRDEIDHLARVKALLERDPRAAYELAQAGNRTLSSMFRQERDGLSVLALDAAGEHARARRLARAFLARHPGSPLRARVAALLEEKQASP